MDNYEAAAMQKQHFADQQEKTYAVGSGMFQGGSLRGGQIGQMAVTAPELPLFESIGAQLAQMNSAHGDALAALYRLRDRLRGPQPELANQTSAPPSPAHEAAATLYALGQETIRAHEIARLAAQIVNLL